MSRIPDFSQLSFSKTGLAPAAESAQWADAVQASTGQDSAELVWLTNEQIPVQPLYRATDMADLEHLNFVAGMDQKALVESKLNAVLAIADFDQGSRYEDFDPAIDKVAAYGLGALVAGKVIAKTGFIAAGLIFLKKFGILLFVALGALPGRLLRRKKKA